MSRLFTEVGEIQEASLQVHLVPAGWTLNQGFPCLITELSLGPLTGDRRNRLPKKIQEAAGKYTPLWGVSSSCLIQARTVIEAS